MNLEKIVKEIVKNLPESDLAKNSLSFNEYIDSYRTIALQLPRGSGKTKTLLNMYSEMSSLLFVHNLCEMPKGCENINRTGIYKFSDLGDYFFKGVNIGNNLKYQCILCDEYRSMSGEQEILLYEYITYLNSRNMLTKDFFILSLTT